MPLPIHVSLGRGIKAVAHYVYESWIIRRVLVGARLRALFVRHVISLIFSFFDRYSEEDFFTSHWWGTN